MILPEIQGVIYPVRKPSISARDDRNRRHQFLIKGGVKALPFLTGFTATRTAPEQPG